MSQEPVCRSHALAEALHQQVLDARIALAQERDGMLTRAELIAKLEAEPPEGSERV